MTACLSGLFLGLSIAVGERRNRYGLQHCKRGGGGFVRVCLGEGWDVIRAGRREVGKSLKNIKGSFANKTIKDFIV